MSAILLSCITNISNFSKSVFAKISILSILLLNKYNSLSFLNLTLLKQDISCILLSPKSNFFSPRNSAFSKIFISSILFLDKESTSKRKNLTFENTLISEI